MFGKPADGFYYVSKVADYLLQTYHNMCYSNVTQMAILVICKRYLFNFIHFGGSEYRVLFQSDERVTSEYRLGREPGAAQDVI
mgnify:CR=1 FL=1